MLTDFYNQILPSAPTMSSDDTRQPIDFINSDNTIDFSDEVWEAWFRTQAGLANTKARSAAIKAFVRKRVKINKKWWLDNMATWAIISSRPYKVEAVFIAAMGSVANTPCAKLCAKSPTGVMLPECITNSPYQNGCCANCRVRDWKIQCDHTDQQGTQQFQSRTT